ncbi:hypothetical protein [Nevskia soli]|uniref:spermine/spermidine synthase domain-containing protein n=1 Tax=Nevskia soli TaxID=418856 RepID=UPI000A059E28|nr:hypothetical protein [Nevskia soli]
MSSDNDKGIAAGHSMGGRKPHRTSHPPRTFRDQLQPWLVKADFQKPFLMDDGVIRALHFSPHFVQSEMNIENPYELTLFYTRKMMAFLLFCPRPKDIVIVGLGGGSLTKFCSRQLPGTRITTVEIDEYVIALGSYFHIPEQDERMRIVHADAADYFATNEERVDVILVDGCDERGIAPAFCNLGFYQCLRTRLRPGGVLVVNLVGAMDIVLANQGFIAAAFSNQLIVQNVSFEGNRVAFAFNDPWSAPDWTAIECEAVKLHEQHGLEFPAFVRKLQHSYEHHGARSCSLHRITDMIT